MTKSTITRERIQRIIRAINSEAYDEEEIREWLSSDEIMELSRMALAAMDSESWCLPLDYLQGHKDGLEWASQLAEANHHETGDWLYDDPIELAKAIRKGPDMPPAQPVADSEPVALTANIERDAQRYRFLRERDAFGDDGEPGLASWDDLIELDTNDFDAAIDARMAHPSVDFLTLDNALQKHERRRCKDRNCNKPIYGYSVDGLCEDCHAAVSQQPAPVVPNGLRLALSNAGIAAPESDEMLAATCEKHIQALVTWVRDRKPFQSAPVVMDDRKLRSLFDSWFASDCSFDLSPEASEEDNIAWRESYWYVWQRCRAAMLQAGNSPAHSGPRQEQSNCSPAIPDGYRLQPISEYEAMCATVNSDEWPQRWIPVSERMPEDRTQVILWDAEIGEVTSGHYSHKTQTFYHCGDAIQNEITHWMLPPSAPQEVNHG